MAGRFMYKIGAVIKFLTEDVKPDDMKPLDAVYWSKMFHWGREFLQVDPCQGGLVTTATSEHVVLGDRHLKKQKK